MPPRKRGFARSRSGSAIDGPALGSCHAAKHEVRLLRRVYLDAAPPEVSKKGPHAEYAKRLVNPSMPKTIAAIRSGGRRGLQFATPSYFFSWVRTDEPAPGRDERLRLRRRGAVGWEPDYPSDEYLAFLECLAGIAADTRA